MKTIRLIFLAALFASYAHATMTVVQHQVQICNTSSASCTITLNSPTGAGHFLFMGSIAFANSAPAFSSNSGESGWAHCSANIIETGTRGGNLGTGDCVFSVSATGGVSTLTWSWNVIPTAGWSLEFVEITDAQPLAFDVAASAADTSCVTCAAQSLTLSGANDLVIQLGLPATGVTAITAPYTADIDANNFAYAFLANVSSFTTPNWTQSSSGTMAVAAIAFKEVIHDTTPPVLTSLNITPSSSIDASAAPVSLTVNWGATDDGAGVKSIAVTLIKMVAGNQYQHALGAPSAIAGAQLFASGTFTITIPRFAASGTWLVNVAVTDAAGNVRNYATEDLTAAGFTSSITVQ